MGYFVEGIIYSYVLEGGGVVKCGFYWDVVFVYDYKIYDFFVCLDLI